MAEARDLERELNEELRAQVELIQSAAGVSDAYYARLAADARLALTQGKISSAQELATLRALEDEKYGLRLKALNDEEMLYGQDETQYARLEDRKKSLTQQHLAAIDALEEQQAKKEDERNQQLARSFQQIFAEPVTRAFDAEVQGILQGTETIGQVTAKVFSDMAVSFIEAVLKMIAQWLAFEAVTAAFGGGAASMLGMSAGPLGMLGGLFGGGGGGSIAYGAAGLASFDVGAWSVPSDMAAIVHTGETILPAPAAGDFRAAVAGLASGAQGGGGAGATANLAVNISTNDARSFLTMINSPLIARGILQLVQRAGLNNPSIPP